MIPLTPLEASMVMSRIVVNHDTTPAIQPDQHFIWTAAVC